MDSITKLITDLLLKAKGAAGAYNPIYNSTIVSSNLSDTKLKEVLRHEAEHFAQFNHSTLSSSDQDQKLADSIVRKTTVHGANPTLFPEDRRWMDTLNTAAPSGTNPLTEDFGYSSKSLPREVPAYVAGSNQDRWPPLGWDKLSDDEKLWLIKNLEGRYTDQDALSNKPITNRVKNLWNVFTGG